MHSHVLCARVSPASPSSASRSAPAPVAPPSPHRAAVGVAAAGARRRRRAASAAPARTRATLLSGRRVGVRPSGDPRPIGRRGSRCVPVAAARWGGGVPSLRQRRPSGRPPQVAPTRAHAQRRRGAPSGGGKDHRQLGAGSGVIQLCPGATPSGGGAAAAGLPPPRQSRETLDATAARQKRSRSFGHRPHGHACGRRSAGGSGSGGRARRFGRHQLVAGACRTEHQRGTKASPTARRTGRRRPAERAHRTLLAGMLAHRPPRAREGTSGTETSSTWSRSKREPRSGKGRWASGAPAEEAASSVGSMEPCYGRGLGRETSDAAPWLRPLELDEWTPAEAAAGGGEDRLGPTWVRPEGRAGCGWRG